jgi:hypothetical protein
VVARRSLIVGERGSEAGELAEVESESGGVRVVFFLFS